MRRTVLFLFMALPSGPAAVAASGRVIGPPFEAKDTRSALSLLGTIPAFRPAPETNSGSVPELQEVLPLGARLLLQLLRRFRHRGELVEVVPRAAGVDDGLGAERRVVLVGDEHRVVLRAHAAADDVDVD